MDRFSLQVHVYHLSCCKIWKYFLTSKNKGYSMLQEMFIQHKACENWEDAVSCLYRLCCFARYKLFGISSLHKLYMSLFLWYLFAFCTSTFSKLCKNVYMPLYKLLHICWMYWYRLLEIDIPLQKLHSSSCKNQSAMACNFLLFYIHIYFVHWP